MSDLLAVPMIALIRLYRLVRPSWIHCCRFEPTCSRYAWQAITLYGPWRGGWKTLCRLARCQPFYPGGMDPV